MNTTFCRNELGQLKNSIDSGAFQNSRNSELWNYMTRLRKKLVRLNVTSPLERRKSISLFRDFPACWEIFCSFTLKEICGLIETRFHSLRVMLFEQ